MVIYRGEIYERVEIRGEGSGEEGGGIFELEYEGDF